MIINYCLKRNQHCEKLPKMFQSKRIPPVILISLLTLLGIYYNINNLGRFYKFDLNTINSMKLRLHYNRRPIVQYNGSEDFLINTPGCYIPNYSKTLRFKEARDAHRTCGQRAVFIDNESNDLIIFRIDKEKLEEYGQKNKKMDCCYRFARRHTEKGKEDSKIIYSPCQIFHNGTKIKLEQEVITVTCYLNLTEKTKSKAMYEDAYIKLKKVNKGTNNGKRDGNSWNILLLGMDTMSRARMYSSMPETVQYMQRNEWLDYRGYQKVDYNTFPNLVSVMTGKNVSTMYKACAKGMYACNKLMIWTKFRDAGFTTAYGEDFLQLPDTFYRYKGFETPPTDHYTRPFFLTGENLRGNLICTQKLPSALHLLDYASHFSNAYKNDSFFGVFWLNSYSHNLNNLPKLIDHEMTEFFEKLKSTGVLSNTFIFFFSDHGIRFGEMRKPIESFYEERLPMLFMWVPHKFRELYEEEYYNLQINQNRLTTPYDLHVTLCNILKISNNSDDIIRSEACPQCTSLFQEKSPNRKCADANVDNKWCSCYNMVKVARDDSGANRSLQLAVTYIQNLTKTIETTACKVCSSLRLKSVLRNHIYRSDADNKTYYVIAFVMSPGDIGYEATVEKDGGNKFKILQPTHTISAYNIRGRCVKNPFQREYCVCNVIKNCNKNKQKIN